MQIKELLALGLTRSLDETGFRCNSCRVMRREREYIYWVPETYHSGDSVLALVDSLRPPENTPFPDADGNSGYFVGYCMDFSGWCEPCVKKIIREPVAPRVARWFRRLGMSVRRVA
jgi:hypothetical protein